MMDNLLVERKIAAILLILCFLVFLVGGMLFTGRAIWKWPAAQTPTYLIWERSFVMAAVLITALGLALLENLLRDAGDPFIARLGLLTYLIGAIVVIVAETSLISSGRSAYAQIIFYVVVAFLAQMAFGLSLLQTGLLPGWVGWATIIWNLAWLIILPIATPGDIYFPVLHHVAPLLIGIALLVRG
jgi:hypothetical protein